MFGVTDAVSWYIVKKMGPAVWIASMTLVVVLTGCSPKPISANGIASELRAVSSYAAEAQLFIEYIQAGKSTKAYARAHACYLVAQLKEARQKLAALPSTEQTLAPALLKCKQQQDMLFDQLNRLSLNVDDPSALAHGKQKFRAIQEDAQQALAGL